LVSHQAVPPHFTTKLRPCKQGMFFISTQCFQRILFEVYSTPSHWWSG